MVDIYARPVCLIFFFFFPSPTVYYACCVVRFPSCSSFFLFELPMWFLVSEAFGGGPEAASPAHR